MKSSANSDKADVLLEVNKAPFEEEVVASKTEKPVKVRLLDDSPRFFEGKKYLLAVLEDGTGYLVEPELVKSNQVAKSDLEKSLKMYDFTSEIESVFPTVAQIREKMWLAGAYNKSLVTHENVRGHFPRVVKVKS